MPGRLPVVSAREVLRALMPAGFYIHHRRGSRARLLPAGRPELRVTVPVHARDVPLPVLRRILRQACLTVEEFLDLL